MYYRAPTSIHPHAPIHVTSANLTRITNALDARKDDRRKFGDEYRSLAERLRPDSGPSVVRHERPVEKSTIDLTNRQPAGKKEIGGAIDEAARRAADVAAIERGESLDDLPDIKTQMATVARKAAATEAIIEKLETEFQAEFVKLSAAHCKTLKPDHDAKMKKFFAAFSDAFSIYSELRKTRQDLIDSQMGFSGLFNVDLDFLRGEEVQSMFHDGKRNGYVNSIHKEIQA